MKAIYLFFAMIITAILGKFSPQDTDEVENLSTPNSYYGTEIIIDGTESKEEQEIIYYDTLEESLYEFGKNLSILHRFGQRDKAGRCKNDFLEGEKNAL